MRELRLTAREALGERFDLRAFHDAQLVEDTLPLDVLEVQVPSWVERQRAR